MAIQETSRIVLPFNSSTWEAFGAKTAYMRNEQAAIPESDWTDPSAVLKWVQESIELSKDVVYNGIKEGEALSDQYLKHARKVVNRQVVLGGLRLSSMIIDIFGQRGFLQE